MKTENLFSIITSAMSFGNDLPVLNNPPFCPICHGPEQNRGSALIKVCPKCQGDLEFPLETKLAKKYCNN